MARRAVVTGGAGFIGSHVAEDLLNEGWEVVLLDNFRTGRREFIQDIEKNPSLKVHSIDLLTHDKLSDFFSDCQRTYHLAANADVRFGPSQPERDLEQNTIVTHRVLEASRVSGVKEFIFSSTGSVYGDSKIIPTPEDAPFPIQTSLYGASKLAGEGLVQAYSEAFGIKSWIFRFVSILGPRYSHGHVYDFCKQLRVNPHKLKVLGNGSQKKSYLHVKDCVEAIKCALKESTSGLQIFNLGTEEYCEVKDSIDWICDELGLSPEIDFGTGNQGWIGDNPFIFLKTEKIRRLGWKPRIKVEEGVRSTIRYLMENQWIFSPRNS